MKQYFVLLHPILKMNQRLFIIYNIAFCISVLLIFNHAIDADATLKKDSKPSQNSKDKKKWDLAFYKGQFTQTNLKNIIIDGQTSYKPSFINVATASKPLQYSIFGFATEGEGQFAYHEGIMKHIEINGLVVFRTKQLSRGLPLRFGFGEGLSLASRNPDLENSRKSILDPNTESEYSRKFLNYLMFEIDLALPVESYKPRAFLRIHHRSGIYGIFCPPTCGSNFIAYGVKFRY